MRIRNLQSLLVYALIPWKISLTRVEWISGWRSWLASLILSWCLAFTQHMWRCVFWSEPLRIRLLRIRCWRRRGWICKNVSRFSMCVPNAWRPIFAARHFYRTAQHSVRIWMRWEKHWLTGNVGLSTAYWLSICQIFRIVHTINFILQFLYYASEFKDSILIFDQFSLAIESNVEPWNHFNFFISFGLLSWASRRSQFCFINCSWRSCWSCRRRSSPWWARQISSFRDSIVSFNFWISTSSVIKGLEFVFSNLCLTVSEDLLPLSVQKNPDLLTFWAVARSFSDVWNLWVKLFHNGSLRSMTDRRLIGRQTFVLRVINWCTVRIFFSVLGEQWWRERYADGDVTVLEVIQGPVLAWGFLDVRFSSLRDVVVIGLITCERVVLSKSAKVRISWNTQGICPPHRGRWNWWTGGKTSW